MTRTYRLPTDVEWSRAAEVPAENGRTLLDRCYYEAGGVYPWGTQWPPPAGSGNFADQAAKAKDSAALYIDGYNEVVTAHVQLKYGTNILKALRTEAGDNFKKARTATSATGNYTVKSGDTLSKIAVNAGVPLKALLKANPDVDPLKLRVGQKILMPADKGKKSSSQPVERQTE